MIICPYCDHQHDSGDYPDHGQGDTLECDAENCHKTFLIYEVEWHPVFRTRKVGP